MILGPFEKNVFCAGHPIHNNGAVLTIAQIIKAVMCSAAEAKIGALYINCREVVPACHTLEFLGHPQLPH